MKSGAIARVLGISPRTVDKHLENVYRKLGRHDRLLVALDKSSDGIVEHPDPKPPVAW